MSAYDDAVAYLDAEVHPRCDYDIYSDMRDIVDDMQAENEKLRELVHKQDALTKAVHAYWAGGERSLDDFNVLMDANVQVLTLMSELGIEVDG